MFPSKSLSLFSLDISPSFQVTLVADEHDDHVAVAVLSGILQPGGQVVEGVSPGDVVNKESSCSPPIVGAGDGSECLLSCCVPDLKLDLFPLNINHPGWNLLSVNWSKRHDLPTPVSPMIPC